MQQNQKAQSLGVFAQLAFASLQVALKASSASPSVSDAADAIRHVGFAFGSSDRYDLHCYGEGGSASRAA